MSLPASETAMSCSMRGGEEVERQRPALPVHPPLQLGGAADAADEVDVLRGPRVVRCRRAAPGAGPGRSSSRARRPDRRRRSCRAGRARATSGRPRKTPNERGASGGGLAGGLHVHHLPQRGQQLGRRAPLRVADQPVVGQDLHLVVREDHRQEGAVLARLAAARGVHARGGGGAVVAVGHVEGRHRRGTAPRSAAPAAGGTTQSRCETPSAVVRSYSGAAPLHRRDGRVDRRRWRGR